MRVLGIVGLFVLILACGAPRAVVLPTTAPSTETIMLTNTPEPTATPEPTKTPGRHISHEQLGDAWPLLVEDGTIICSGASILLRTNRGLFAVNGTARGQNKWKDIRSITKPDPNNAGLIMSVQPIVDRGLLVCR